jgi:predicted acyl esterase
MQESARPAAFYAHRDGRWVAEPGWPSANITPKSWALNADGLSAKSAPEAALQVSSPQTTGMAAGEWCPIWLGPESPTDQRPDDAGSLCFDSTALSERLEILGAPVVEIDLAIDKPQGVIAVRLNEVFADGASARVTYGVLNLSHRMSDEHPAPMTPGTRTRVRVQLNDIAHAFAPGSRLRVAVSTAYWPLIWPSAEPVVLTLFAGSSRVTLPVRPQRAESLADFSPAEAAPKMGSEVVRKSENGRRIEQDLATGETRLSILDDFGEKRIIAHGLEVGSVARETYSIRPYDPLSARAETHWTELLGRGDWRIRTETYTTQWADRDSFHIEAEMEAFEGETRVFHRSWKRQIPRENM